MSHDTFTPTVSGASKAPSAFRVKVSGFFDGLKGIVKRLTSVPVMAALTDVAFAIPDLIDQVKRATAEKENPLEKLLAGVVVGAKGVAKVLTGTVGGLLTMTAITALATAFFPALFVGPGILAGVLGFIVGGIGYSIGSGIFKGLFSNFMGEEPAAAAEAQPLYQSPIDKMALQASKAEAILGQVSDVVRGHTSEGHGEAGSSPKEGDPGNNPFATVHFSGGSLNRETLTQLQQAKPPMP